MNTMHGSMMMPSAAGDPAVLVIQDAFLKNLVW